MDKRQDDRRKGSTGQVIDPAGIAHPSHYNEHPSGIEVIDIARWMTFNLGSAFKYVLRRGQKIEPGLTLHEMIVKDLKKATWYIDDELKNNVPSAPLPLTVYPLMKRMALTDHNLDASEFITNLRDYHLRSNITLLHECNRNIKNLLTNCAPVI